jgi:hypothetical protein
MKDSKVSGMVKISPAQRRVGSDSIMSCSQSGTGFGSLERKAVSVQTEMIRHRKGTFIHLIQFMESELENLFGINFYIHKKEAGILFLLLYFRRSGAYLETS